MRFFCLTLTLCLILLQMPAKAQSDSFVVDGVYRNYIYHLPTGYNASNSYPLVLNLHGYTSNASQQLLYTQMNTSADANGYIVVYPNGIANYWNSWGPPGGSFGANDVKFLTELIDTVSAHYHVNPKRVYSCGMSNGGYMSYSLACAIADRLAAIASVSGTMSTYTYSTCNPARKIPVMHVHGTADNTVPYATGATGSIGVEQTITFWRDTDACQNISDTVNLPNLATGDSCTVQTIHYQHCANGNDILFYKIANGGHTWPGGFVDIPAFGNTDRDITATNEIWNFFNRYTLDGPIPAGINDIKNVGVISIYPNPVTQMLTIKTDQEILVADIYDAAGRKVMSSAKNKSIDVSSLEAGMYVVKVNTTHDMQSVTKFVKQ
ncbi:MAG: C-terminal target protein [Bacteroidetes bacterium]|nr:C-terminal target protein [Bacteroidota bacterium]